ncbi:MAG: class F sortase [Streptosporangiaceae bacterium]
MRDSNSETRGGHRSHRGVVAAAACGITGIAGITGAVLVAVAGAAQQTPPPPPRAPAASAASPTAQPSGPHPTGSHGGRSGQGGKGGGRSRHRQAPATLNFSRPTSITIPAIDVRAPVLALGKKPDGAIKAPPLTKEGAAKTAWYKGSADPGQIGPAIIEGHVDSAKYGPAVFYKLGALRPGDKIRVARADGTTVVFSVDKVRQYPKDDFPTLAVYGPVDHPALRLITCGGAFNDDIGHYQSNIVAYADQVAVRRR